MSQTKIWRLGKDGFEETTATINEGMFGNEVVYDPKYRLEEKEYRVKCQVCLVQEQGFACEAILNNPGPFEYEGGCMDCKFMCGKPPVYVGVRNYCLEHIGIMNRKLGVKKDE